ncbi:MAG: DNA ligase-associated DEXH box helicase [Salinisphaeraceae bacterium]|nr:DNA ligase-associated DEXH box helicase [Salinisphaeraceae bacterium]
MIELTDNGLYCPAGDFHVDPWRPVERAVLTHGHADHARPGSRRYLAAESGLGILRSRLGRQADIQGLAYGEAIRMAAARVSLHPAGHVLGSAQVRIETDDGVLVASGDYKRDEDPSCEPFEVVPCDTFITEATFALPVYRWPDGAAVARDILSWWQANAAAGRSSLLFCYALGKAQRLLAELARLTDETVYMHGALVPLVQVYRDAGIRMLPTEPVSQQGRKADFAGRLILAPPSAAGTPWMRRFGKHSTGFASGWMRIRGNRRRRGYDRGFVLSDHADWPALVRTIEQTGARRVLVTHGRSDVLVRHLRQTLGVSAEALETAYAQTPEDEG